MLDPIHVLDLAAQADLPEPSYLPHLARLPLI